MATEMTVWGRKRNPLVTVAEGLVPHSVKQDLCLLQKYTQPWKFSVSIGKNVPESSAQANVYHMRDRKFRVISLSTTFVSNKIKFLGRIITCKCC